ncbi:MAG: sulfotransferase family 2 domain-containing protein [Hyphomicrobiales bacterium]
MTLSWFFVHIQKTGGNSIRAALGLPANTPQKHFLARELRDLYGPDAWRQSYKFAFVRNPWDRLVSWWMMIDARRDEYQPGQPIDRFWQFVLSRAKTFEEFLENCDAEVNDPDGRKWIYRNQLDYIVDETGQQIVDFVGRFEALQKDFDAVARKICGDRVISLPVENASKHGPYPEYYSPALAHKVAERFARDIDTFGYRFGES